MEEREELTHAITEDDPSLEPGLLHCPSLVLTRRRDLDVLPKQDTIHTGPKLGQVEVLEDLVRLLADNVVRDLSQSLEALRWRECDVDAARSEELHVHDVILLLAIDSANRDGAGLEDGGREQVVVGCTEVEVDGDCESDGSVW